MSTWSIRRGIGRRDDGAERDRGGDRETAQPPTDPRNRCRRETDGEDDQRHERDDVPPEVTRRGVECGVQQDGSDKEREGQIGLDLEVGTRGDEGQRGAGDREERGIRNPDTPGDAGQEHRSEEKRQRRFEERHVPSLERRPALGEPKEAVGGAGLFHYLPAARAARIASRTFGSMPAVPSIEETCFGVSSRTRPSPG